MRASRQLREQARALRRRPTRAEHRLWYGMLRHLQPQWYRQRPLGGYIADFYCAALGLVIEVDGDVHRAAEAQHYDAERTAVLRGAGLRVLRVGNAAVLDRFAATTAALHRMIDAHAAALDVPLTRHPRQRNTTRPTSYFPP